MTKDKDIKTVVPALRFPEFRDADGWSEKTIDSICKSFSGGTPKTTEGSYYGGDIPFIRSAEINKESTELFLTENGLLNSAAKLVNKGDVLVALYGANSGDVAISKINGAINQAILCLKSKDCNQFVCQYLALKKDDIISTYIQGGQGNLSGEIIKSLKLLFPKPNEQQKIADCLGSLDDLISAVADKIEVLKEHKKGLMQQLFPADGKTTPTLRFPEFQNAGEWRETILGKYIEIKGRIGYRGYTTNDIVEKNNGAISLSPTNITDNGELVFDKCTYISWEKYDESPEIRLEKGYVVLVKTGSSYGKSAIVKTLPEKATINPQIVVLKPQKIDSIFLSLLISHSSIQKQINETVVGGAIPTLSQDSISKFKILIPKVEEQKAVADFLSSVDDLISAETDKLDQLKAHKKGLMQQLFPTINE